MASFSFLSLLTLSLLFSAIHMSRQQPLESFEQESVYQVLDSINSQIPWRTLFPDDLCLSAPHGIFCDYFEDLNGVVSAHIVELNFGFVSDYNPNPPCTPDSALSPLLFTSFPRLAKLFFYKCFNGSTRVNLPGFDPNPNLISSLKELVFIENPSLVGPLSGILRNFTNLERAVLSGNGFYGEIPDGVAELSQLVELTVSRNELSGRVPDSISNLKNLRILDLSHNEFYGLIPKSVSELTQLLKLDLSWNSFNGSIPESLKNLKSLHLLDLSFNRFTNSGIPLFLSEFESLREVYLSGNNLGGVIPEIWHGLRSLLGIGLSGNGLLGKIPSSMGIFLSNASYIGLNDNMLEGTLPEELNLLENVNELNLKNNRLSGRVPFSAKFSAKIGSKLKLEGNPDLCIEEGLMGSKNLGHLKVCDKPSILNPVLLVNSGDSISSTYSVSKYFGWYFSMGLLGMLVWFY
ncbi:Leucine-rich repeat [Dillenia turbinata]|uniref:non-specific serine/threonine protein kinase n=1 Tax=Dillenia turbinata TaxID=194707 RepID=A0AAN8VV56_9MAGN